MSRFPLALLLAAACAPDPAPSGDTDSDTSGATSTGASTTTLDPSTTTTSSSSTADTSAGEASEGSSDESSADTGAAGCDGVALRPIPDDAAARGPWPVGAATVVLDGLTVEVWYPAVPGSERGMAAIVYDIRDQLPESEQGKISDEDNPPQPCDCWRDLPIDDGYGPYPALVFVHGTASFRTQSLPQMIHWASRGFVVLAADHPGLRLADMLGMVCGGSPPMRDLDGDIAKILAAVRGETDELAAFAPAIDGARLGFAGHSAGGTEVGTWSNDAQVLVPLAAGGTDPGTALGSTLVMGGTDDSVVAYAQQQSGFESSPAPKRFVGIEGGGHLSFSEICSLQNGAGQNLLEIAEANGVCGAQLAGFLFQCSDELVDDALAWDIIDYATAIAFEETLHCSDIGATFTDIATRFDAVAEVRQR